MNNISTLGRKSREVAAHCFDKRRFQVYTQRDIGRIHQLDRLPEEDRFAMQVVSSVLPFRVNDYVLNELIDWNAAPDDPLYRLIFPQREMLAPGHFNAMADAIHDGDKQAIQSKAREIRDGLNPHPAGQIELNRPRLFNGEPINGLQHKYRETLLFFPSQGQTCHSYCTFCFRWAQFIGDKNLRIASTEAASLHQYLHRHTEITDLLLTGGDPMVMKTKHLVSYLEPLLRPEFDHIQTIRIGTKALSFWPYRFVTDEDTDELLILFERIVESGKHLAIMAHYNHWQELSTHIAIEAVHRLRGVGAEIRSQGPLLAHINDSAEVWARMWNTQVRHGIIPYYMFVERDTGARHFFEVPLIQAWEIYRGAMQQVSGLGRTARGPSMSAGPGKVEIQGVTEINGEKVIALRFIQGRNSDWVQRPFFARHDETATWLDHLKPAFDDSDFFFEAEYKERWLDRIATVMSEPRPDGCH